MTDAQIQHDRNAAGDPLGRAADRNTALTQRDDLDVESRALAEARIQESLRILAQLDKGNADGVRD